MVDVRPLLAQKLYDEMAHALGGTHSRRFSSQDTVNDVLEEVTSMHPWRFLEGGTYYVDTRGNIDFTGQNWEQATLKLGVAAGGAWANYTFTPNDHVQITSGTGVELGWFEIASQGDENGANTDDFLILKKSISSAGVDLSNTDIGGATDTHTIVLPDDFRSLNDASFTADTSSTLEIASPERVAAVRRSLIHLGTGRFLCAAGWVQDETTGSPSMRALLEITPTPSSSGNSVVQITYKKRLVPVSGDRSVIVCPPFMHNFIKHMCREWAKGLERPEGGTVAERITRLKQTALYLDALDADGDIQVTAGQLVNGHMPRRDGFPIDLIGDGGLTIGGPTTV